MEAWRHLKPVAFSALPMAAWQRAVLMAASCCDLAAGAVTVWWALPGYVAGMLFALLFLVAGLVLTAATFKASLRLLVVALVLTVIGELEPVGGVMASVALHQSPGLGSLLPLGAAALSIVGTLAVLMLDRLRLDTRHS
jgi:hypothetical protein